MPVLPLFRSTGTLTRLLRHLLLYLPLLRAAAEEYRRKALRQVLCLLAASCVALSAVLVGTAWLFMSAWQSSYRHWLLGGALLLLVLVSAALLRLAVGQRDSGPHVQRLRDELSQDHALLQEWQRTL
jgi:ABC-type Fe3+ transport system permease subunit